MEMLEAYLPSDRTSLKEEADRLESILRYAARPASIEPTEPAQRREWAAGLRNTLVSQREAIQKLDSQVQEITTKGRLTGKSDIGEAKRRSSMAAEWIERLIERMNQHLEEEKA